MPQQVTRPLRVLVPLIKEDLSKAELAGVPYYRAAGEKLLEAKEQVPHGEFVAWYKSKFKISQQTASQYMLLARDTQNTAGAVFSSGREHRRHRSEQRRSTNGGSSNQREAPRQPPPAIQIDRAESEASKKLAFKIVSAGYRIVAQECHPDSGGSHEMMARLNRVRTNLKTYIERSD